MLGSYEGDAAALCLLFLLLLTSTVTTTVGQNVGPPNNSKEATASRNKFQAVVRRPESDAALFEPPDALRVLGPTHFPPPTSKFVENHDNNTTIPPPQVLLQPTFGQHRPDQDVVVAYAEGYRLAHYMWFLQTLTQTGFRGDVVLAIATDDLLQADVKTYLQTYTTADNDNKPSVVLYQIPLWCDNSDPNNHRRSISKRSHELDVFQMCRFGPGVYGWPSSNDDDGDIRVAQDPRKGRTVATLRYEWYWMVAQQYDKHSWMLLLDARDAYFQSNPFVDLPRDTSDTPSGILYFFGENANATRLGISKKNRNWITRGYGDAAMNQLQNYPTICSGSTMGEQIAIETYLRAMVNEHDECEVKMTGSDQGFHNYLYYSQKLSQASTIRRIVVWEQGRGMINNLGALRIKTLEEWGNYDPETHAVYQWDGQTLSPIVHQWDRDNHLHKYIYVKEFNRLEKEWREQQQ